MENELIIALRELREKIAESQIIATKTLEVTEKMFETTVQNMIHSKPEIWGKEGSQRQTLERICGEKGLDGDLGLQSDFGPFNNSKE